MTNDREVYEQETMRKNKEQTRKSDHFDSGLLSDFVCRRPIGIDFQSSEKIIW